MHQGGYPEAQTEPNPKYYLSSLYSSIVTKDILLRHHIRFSKIYKEFAGYVFHHFASQITYNKLKNIFNLKSAHTAQNYISYLEECFLIFLMERFSFKPKERVQAPRKLYVVDSGLLQNMSVGFSENKGRLIENLVAIELWRRSSTELDTQLYYWQDVAGHEVDFLIWKGRQIDQLIQVCYELSNPDTQQRELRALLKAAKQVKCHNLLIISSDTEKQEIHEGLTICYLPLWKWLVEN